MTRVRRWWLLVGFGITLTLVSGRFLQILWQIAALAFLALAALTIRAGRRRSYRKFVLEPNERVDHLVPNYYADHTKDIL